MASGGGVNSRLVVEDDKSPPGCRPYEIRRLERMKNLQHRIQVNIAKKNGTKE